VLFNAEDIEQELTPVQSIQFREDTYRSLADKLEKRMTEHYTKNIDAINVFYVFIQVTFLRFFTFFKFFSTFFKTFSNAKYA